MALPSNNHRRVPWASVKKFYTTYIRAKGGNSSNIVINDTLNDSDVLYYNSSATSPTLSLFGAGATQVSLGRDGSDRCR